MTADLDVVFINRLGQVVDIHLAVEGEGGGALHQALNLRPAEVLGPLCIHSPVSVKHSSTIDKEPEATHDADKDDTHCYQQ